MTSAFLFSPRLSPSPELPHEACAKMTPFRRSPSQRDKEDKTDLDVVEGRFVCDVIEQKQSWGRRREGQRSDTHTHTHVVRLTMGVAVVGMSDTAETLLSSSVPDL